MINLFSKTNDFRKLINSLNKTNYFIKDDSFNKTDEFIQK